MKIITISCNILIFSSRIVGYTIHANDGGGGGGDDDFLAAETMTIQNAILFT